MFLITNAHAPLQDDFLLGKKLASGGFGTVYAAELVDPESRERRCGGGP